MQVGTRAAHRLMVLWTLLVLASIAWIVQKTPGDPHVRWALLWIAIGGCFGGIVDGLQHNVSYKFALPSALFPEQAAVLDPQRPRSKREYELGFLGDAGVGVVAAFSVFVASVAVFPSANQVNLSNLDLVRVVATSLLAGWLGPRLLRVVSEKLESAQSANEKAGKAQETATLNESARLRREAVQPLLDFASRQLANVQILGLFHTAEHRRARVTALERTTKIYAMVVAYDKQNVAAWIGLAAAYAAAAEMEKDDGKALESLRKAVAVLQPCLGDTPAHARALYNLACYKAMAVGRRADAYPVAEIVGALRKACGLLEPLKEYVLLDEDFDSLRAHPQKIARDDLKLMGVHVLKPEVHERERVRG